MVYRRYLSWRGLGRAGVGANLAPNCLHHVMDDEKPELPEWLRVIWIFIATFALMVVLSGFVIKIDWVEDRAMTPEMFNRPY